MHGLFWRHAEERLGPIRWRSEIDIQVGGILENQNTFFPGHLKNGLTASLTERKTAGIVSIRHGVIQRHEVTLLTRRSDLSTHYLGKRTLAIHIDTEDRCVLAQRNPRSKAGVSRCVGNVGHLLTGMLKHGANQVYATGCAHRWNEFFWIQGQAPILAIDIGKRLPR